MSDGDKKNSIQEKIIHDYLGSLLYDVTSKEKNELPSPINLVDEPIDIVDVDVKHSSEKKLQYTSIAPSKPLIKPDEKIPHKTAIAPSVIGLEQLISEVPDVVLETKTEVITKTEVKEEALVKSIEIDIEMSSSTLNVSENLISENGVPKWAETRFQCLLFNVLGLNLAVPLVKLNSVIPWDENITITPNNTQWYLGLVQHLNKQVKVIDTALLVLPENRHQNINDDTNGRLSHILLVDDFKWGLACSSIGEVIWLNKEEVKWRKNKTSKGWLSGTSLEHLCALIDTEVFAKMLTESSQSTNN